MSLPGLRVKQRTVMDDQQQKENLELVIELGLEIEAAYLRGLRDAGTYDRGSLSCVLRGIFR